MHLLLDCVHSPDSTNAAVAFSTAVVNTRDNSSLSRQHKVFDDPDILHNIYSFLRPETSNFFKYKRSEEAVVIGSNNGCSI